MNAPRVGELTARQIGPIQAKGRELIVRQIHTIRAPVFADIAQNVGYLQSDAEFDRIRNGFRLTEADDVHAQDVFESLSRWRPIQLIASK